MKLEKRLFANNTDVNNFFAKKINDIPRVIQESEVEQGGSSNFSAGTRDIAKGKDRSEDEKYEAKPTPRNRFLNHERYRTSLMAQAKRT